jgi:type III secretion system YscI/HrpB-like protein
MSPLTTVVLDPVVTRGASVGEATRSAESLKQRVAAFDDALSRQSAVAPGQPNVQLAQASTTTAPPDQVQSVNINERTRRALDVDGVKDAPRPSGGDLILDGLQKLRGAFDSRHSSVSKLMGSSALDASMLMSMQMEVVNYTLMVDVTSKLTGKSTQSFDTLMKGQ